MATSGRSVASVRLVANRSVAVCAALETLGLNPEGTSRSRRSSANAEFIGSSSRRRCRRGMGTLAYSPVFRMATSAPAWLTTRSSRA